MKLFDVYSLLDMEPIKASGAYLWDKDGVEYLDFYGDKDIENYLEAIKEIQ